MPNAKEHLAKALSKRRIARGTAWKILRTWKGVPISKNGTSTWLVLLREHLYGGRRYNYFFGEDHV